MLASRDFDICPLEDARLIKMFMKTNVAVDELRARLNLFRSVGELDSTRKQHYL